MDSATKFTGSNQNPTAGGADLPCRVARGAPRCLTLLLIL